jgi:hypothetical protein
MENLFFWVCLTSLSINLPDDVSAAFFLTINEVEWGQELS